jgi:hypothetical protein
MSSVADAPPRHNGRLSPREAPPPDDDIFGEKWEIQQHLRMLFPPARKIRAERLHDLIVREVADGEISLAEAVAEYDLDDDDAYDVDSDVQKLNKKRKRLKRLETAKKREASIIRDRKEGESHATAEIVMHEFWIDTTKRHYRKPVHLRGSYTPDWLAIICDNHAETLIMSRLWYRFTLRLDGKKLRTNAVMNDGHAYAAMTDEDIIGVYKRQISSTTLRRAKRSLERRGLIETRQARHYGMKKTHYRPLLDNIEAAYYDMGGNYLDLKHPAVGIVWDEGDDDDNDEDGEM